MVILGHYQSSIGPLNDPEFWLGESLQDQTDALDFHFYGQTMLEAIRSNILTMVANISVLDWNANYNSWGL
jgi:hypothetical protein